MKTAIDDNGVCVLGRKKNGELSIISCPELFICSRAAIEAQVSSHNEMRRELDEAAERVTHAEILLGELASGYWRFVLNDNDPSGEGVMGERVIQYWARYSDRLK